MKRFKFMKDIVTPYVWYVEADTLEEAIEKLDNGEYEDRDEEENWEARFWGEEVDEDGAWIGDELEHERFHNSWNKN